MSRNHGASGCAGTAAGRAVAGPGGGSMISYSRLGFTPRTTECPRRRQPTSMARSWAVPAAKLYSGSEPERYVPPSTTSFCCTGTGPPSTRIFEPVHDDVQIAVAVQVRRRHAVRNGVLTAEPPLCADVRERQVAVVAEGNAPERQ